MNNNFNNNNWNTWGQTESKPNSTAFPKSTSANAWNSFGYNDTIQPNVNSNNLNKNAVSQPNYWDNFNKGMDQNAQNNNFGFDNKINKEFKNFSIDPKTNNSNNFGFNSNNSNSLSWDSFGINKQIVNFEDQPQDYSKFFAPAEKPPSNQHSEKKSVDLLNEIQDERKNNNFLCSRNNDLLLNFNETEQKAEPIKNVNIMEDLLGMEEKQPEKKEEINLYDLNSIQF